MQQHRSAAEAGVFQQAIHELARQQDEISHQWKAIEQEWAKIKADKQSLKREKEEVEALREEVQEQQRQMQRHDQRHSTNAPSEASSGTTATMANAAAATPRLFVDINGPFWITIWPGNTRHGRPHRLLMQNCTSMQHLISRACRELNCYPPPNLIYTPDGHTISQLKGVKAGKDYLLLTSGSLYRESAVPTLLLEKLVNGAAAGVASSFDDDDDHDGSGGRGPSQFTVVRH